MNTIDKLILLFSMTDAEISFGNILINIIIAAIAALIAYLLAVSRFKREKNIELHVERDKAFLRAYEELWVVCRFVSNNRDNTNAIIWKSKDVTNLNPNNADGFVNEYNSFEATKHGLYIKTFTRRKLEDLRGELISVLKSSESNEGEFVELKSDKKIKNLNALFGTIRKKLREDTGMTNPDTNILKRKV